MWPTTQSWVNYVIVFVFVINYSDFAVIVFVFDWEIEKCNVIVFVFE